MTRPTLDELRAAPKTIRRERAGEWVKIVMANQSVEEPRPHGHCTRCGDRLVIVLPIPVEVFVAMTKAFVKMHKRCAARSNP